MELEIRRNTFERASPVEDQGAKPSGVRARTHDRHAALVPVLFEKCPGPRPTTSDCHLTPPGLQASPWRFPQREASPPMRTTDGKSNSVAPTKKLPPNFVGRH